VTQFAGLERRTFPTGKDRVNHCPAGHDDLCNAAAGALELAAQEPVQKIPMVGVSWWSKRTGWVEPGHSATNVPGGPSYRATPRDYYLKGGQSGEPWAAYTQTHWDRWKNYG
jgi:hypothetical protein